MTELLQKKTSNVLALINKIIYCTTPLISPYCGIVNMIRVQKLAILSSCLRIFSGIISLMRDKLYAYANIGRPPLLAEIFTFLRLQMKTAVLCSPSEMMVHKKESETNTWNEHTFKMRFTQNPFIDPKPIMRRTQVSLPSQH